MDNTKATIKSYQKQEWQELTNLQLGALSSIIEGIAKGFVTSKDKAELQQRTDPENIPPHDAVKGCLLTDANFIKSANYADNGDGTATITIVLNDEQDPEPLVSNTGKIFPCMSRNEILEKLADIKAITVNSFVLTYNNCTVKMTFNTATNQMTSMDYTMPVNIAAEAKALLTLNVTGVLTDYIEIRNATY